VVRGRGATARAVRTLEYSYVRWHARGSSFRRSRWSALVRSALLLIVVLLLVPAIAREPTSDCAGPIDVEVAGVDQGDLVSTTGRALAVLAWWVVAIVLAIVAIRRVVRLGQRRSMWMYPNWHRRIQGALASTVGRILLIVALLAVLALAASGACDAPEWFGVSVGCAVFGGLVLTVLGSAVATEAGWVGFALVVIVDLFSAALLVGFALLVPQEAQPAVIAAVAFGIHATCTTFACRWSFVVATTPGARADDRAKAGETGRSLCALWVLLLIGCLVVILDEGLADRAVAFLTSPIFVALTLGALAVTMGGGHTKYVEGREAARRRVRDRRSARTMTFDRRDDLVPRIAARMIAACGALSTGDIAGGVNRMAAFELGDRQLRRELAGTHLLSRNKSDDSWDLAPGVDPAPHLWPTDRALQELVGRAGGGRFTGQEIARLLDDAGYRGRNAGGYLRDNHPLIRPVGRAPTRRWSVLPGRLTRRPDADRAHRPG